MKHLLTNAVITLFVLSGVLFSVQTSFAAPYDSAPYGSMPYGVPYGNAPYGAPYGNVPFDNVSFVAPPNYYGGPMYYSPAIGNQAPDHPMTPTQVRTGYTRGEIRAMPLIDRPNRPGHFIGNTIRRRAGVGQ